MLGKADYIDILGSKMQKLEAEKKLNANSSIL